MPFDSPEIPPPKLISALRGFDLLPAIVFLPTRRKCDEAALDVSGDKGQKTDPAKQAKRQQIFDEFVAENPEIRKHKHKNILINAGVASHHAGHMPAWKLVVEKMMSGGLLNAIFATSTVAAGVDFPARTVVITNADTRGNDGWRSLRASELQQMTGRAGRRGKDNVGFAILAPGQFQNPKKIAELLKAKPDPLHSQFKATYTSLLNLLDAFGEFEYVREIAEKSFAFSETRKQIESLRNERERKLDEIGKIVGGIPGQLPIDTALGFERLISVKNRLHSNAPSRSELRQKWLSDVVVPGRIVTQGRSGKRFFLVIDVHGQAISAMRDDGNGTTFPISRVNRVYEHRYGMRDADLEQAFFDVVEGKNEPLDEPKLQRASAITDAAEALIDQAVGRLIPESLDGSERAAVIQELWSTYEVASSVRTIARDTSFLRERIWLPFERRARVLDHFEYLDFAAQKVTPRGKWLADLRVDRPLLVGEVIDRGILDDLEPKILAGVMASIASDPDRNYGELYLSDPLMDAIRGIEDAIFDVSKIESKFGVEIAEEINLSAAAAAERWTAGMTWPDLVNRTKAEEGDLVRLLSRTGEALLQIAHLKDANPKVADAARQTSEILLREPVR
ncbi:MAG: helicase-related protein [Acidobacteriota bacterium]